MHFLNKAGMAVARSKKKVESTTFVTTQATPPMEFRKTNEAIGLRVREGKLSLLTRKIFNVMMYHAQEQRTPGVNAPIDTPAAKKYFWIPLSNLARDAAYDSKDTEFLKKQLEELQNIKLLMVVGLLLEVGVSFATDWESIGPTAEDIRAGNEEAAKAKDNAPCTG